MKQFTQKNTKKYIVSFSIITALAGCGGGSEKPISDNNNIVSSPTAPIVDKNTTTPNPTVDKNTTVEKPIVAPDTFVCTKNKPWECGALKVSSNKMLQHADGSDFFWMADTAWDLYMKSKADIDTYLSDRASKKFTVIQAVGMHSHWSHPHDNQYPFVGGGRTTAPNEIYWKHIDYMIDKAAEKGLYIAFFPVWHHAVVNKTFMNPAESEKFGTWIANRYKDKKNIIWAVGGDTPVDAKPPYVNRAPKGMTVKEEKAIWNGLGSAIDKVVGDTQLITFHPLLTIPSQIFGKAKWLDFNMLQSGRHSTWDSVEIVQRAAKEGLAVVDGESLYENFGLGANGGESDRRTAYQVRDDAYSQIFAGAFGNTYGHGSIFRFWEETKAPPPCTWACFPNMTWKKALNADGGTQMQYVTKLMQSRPQSTRVSDQTIIVGTPSAFAPEGIIGTRGDGYAMIYTPHGKDINAQLGKISGDEVKAWWYNTKTGKATEIGTFENSGTHIFETPGEETAVPKHIFELIKSGNDWVLVLDDLSKGYSIRKK